MVYRNLGKSGLKVSAISFGTWTNDETTVEEMTTLLRTCFDHGVNFIDTALSNGKGKTVKKIGQALKNIGIERSQYVICTKILRSEEFSINSNEALNKKHIRENLAKTLDALQTEYVDIALAHSYDDQTSMEEICQGFHEAIEEGLIFYWGTSNWDANHVFKALEVC